MFIFDGFLRENIFGDVLQCSKVLKEGFVPVGASALDTLAQMQQIEDRNEEKPLPTGENGLYELTPFQQNRNGTVSEGDRPIDWELISTLTKTGTGALPQDVRLQDLGNIMTVCMQKIKENRDFKQRLSPTQIARLNSMAGMCAYLLRHANHEGLEKYRRENGNIDLSKFMANPPSARTLSPEDATNQLILWGPFMMRGSREEYSKYVRENSVLTQPVWEGYGRPTKSPDEYLSPMDYVDYGTYMSLGQELGFITDVNDTNQV